MANIFTITRPPQTLKADSNGRATTVFTITNTTSRPLRGIAKIKPLGNTEAAWLKIEGETERDFPAGGTHQFTVNFTKPKPATLPHPAETFEFRLDAFAADNPDEDFTEGPTVTVETAEQKEETKKFPWWILIVIGVVLIVGAVIAILLMRGGGSNDPEPTPTPTVTPTETPTATPTATPTKTPGPPRMSAREYGFDRPGSDFQKFTAPSVQFCETACQENSQCKAYTFANTDNYCWLKNAVPSKVSNENFTSGTKVTKIIGRPQILDKSAERLIESNK